MNLSNRVLAGALAVLVTGLVVIAMIIAGVFGGGEADSSGDGAARADDPFGEVQLDQSGADELTAQERAARDAQASADASAEASQSPEGSSDEQPTESGQAPGRASGGDSAEDGGGEAQTVEAESDETSDAQGDDESAGGSAGDGADQSPQQGTETSGPRAYVIASRDGVVRRVDGADTEVTTQSARIGFGVDDLVVFETMKGRRATGVRVWSPSAGDRDLPAGDGADSRRLLGAGSRAGRPVALVSERTSGEQPGEATERLVAVDLRDGRRTVISEGLNAFESGWLSAHLLPDGDVVALRQSEVTASLIRIDPVDGRQWRTTVAEDRDVALAALGSRLWIVGAETPEGSATTLRVTAYAAADGSATDKRQIALDEALPGRVRCSDWYDDARLSCTTSTSPRAVTVRGDGSGAASGSRGPAKAVLTAVATTG